MNVIRMALITCLVVWVVAPVSSQNRVIWEAYVQPERVAVYESNSTESSITNTLIRGDLVDVIFEVNASGTQWCRIARDGASEPLGFVLCLNLGKVPVTSKQSHRAAAADVAPVAATGLAAEAPRPSAVLTNQDIIELHKAGLPEQVLVAKIKASQCEFDTSPARLRELKSSGVADAVILAMVEAPNGEIDRRPPSSDPPTTTSTTPAMPDASASDGKVRVLVTDSQSWEMRGGSSAGGNRNGWGASSWIAGGARPQTVEIIKTLNQRCPEIIVTSNLAKADFVITLDHEGGKNLLAHRNKIAVFNRDGDDIFSDSTRELGNSVKDACQVMLNSKR